MEWKERGQSGTDPAVYQLISTTLRKFPIKTVDNTANDICRHCYWHCKDSDYFNASSFSSLLRVLFIFFCNRDIYFCFPQTQWGQSLHPFTVLIPLVSMQKSTLEKSTRGVKVWVQNLTKVNAFISVFTDWSLYTDTKIGFIAWTL